MYELFVLGELMTGEKHGYMLQDVLKNSVGMGRKISSGTLYPLLSRMTEEGWIRLRLEEETKGGRTKKIYEITEAGRIRFLQLMEKPLESSMDGETELIFRFKMVYFLYVDKTVRLNCLTQYLHIIEKNYRLLAGFESDLQSYKPEPERQRVQLLRALDHRKRLAEVDIAWVKEEIERVREEADF
ncbi:PadR family transcriptional regulator [Paenibacillus nanensis]|uniref:PadR family transcriptional regulator n=1 Tax=Paenibacillus nanensis TaxID=393251 RepID=A0A3A1UN01_9BACL|nr:PadR family transcriptional regulator [Paenibacillus nanensis]RIX46570.1 PadR family transcriptional regulator [Paenibacillus nanensis]